MSTRWCAREREREELCIYICTRGETRWAERGVIVGRGFFCFLPLWIIRDVLFSLHTCAARAGFSSLYFEDFVYTEQISPGWCALFYSKILMRKSTTTNFFFLFLPSSSFRYNIARAQLSSRFSSSYFPWHARRRLSRVSRELYMQNNGDTYDPVCVWYSSLSLSLSYIYLQRVDYREIFFLHMWVFIFRDLRWVTGINRVSIYYILFFLLHVRIVPVRTNILYAPSCTIMKVYRESNSCAVNIHLLKVTNIARTCAQYTIILKQSCTSISLSHMMRKYLAFQWRPSANIDFEHISNIYFGREMSQWSYSLVRSLRLLALFAIRRNERNFVLVSYKDSTQVSGI